MREDLIKILNMVKEDTINVFDAADFIETLYNSKNNEEKRPKKYIRIRVEKNNKRMVNIRFPLSVLKFSKGIIKKNLKSSDLDKEDINEINEAIDNLINSNSNEEIEILTDDGEKIILNLE